MSSLRSIVTALLCAVLVLMQADPAVAQVGAAPSAAAGGKDRAGGIHFFFDAAASMCAYLKGNDAHKPLLQLIRFASGLRDVERNRRVVLIRQKLRQGSAGELVEPKTEEFQALAAGGSISGNCPLLDGNFSRVVKAFDKPGFAPKPRSFVLVSDMVLNEKELDEFVDRFRQWARGVEAGQPHSAGIVSLSVDAAGRYFPVTDTKNERAGYMLPAFARPLHVLWFAVGEADQRVMRDMLKELGVQGDKRPPNWLYGLQLLPTVSEDPVLWLAPPPPLTAEALFGAPRAKVEMVGQQRNAGIVQPCPQPRLRGSELRVSAGKCRDDKPLFDASVDVVRIDLPLRAEHGLRLEEDGAAGAEAGGAVTLTVRRTTSQEVHRYAVKPARVALNRKVLEQLRADSDTCAPQPQAQPPARGASAAAAAQAAWTSACVQLLAGRTLRYDILVNRLASRAEDVLVERYTGRTLSLTLLVDR